MAVSLTIDSQDLDIAGAWHHYDGSLLRLLSTVASRGDNRLIPNVEGRVAYASLVDEHTVDLEMVVYGAKNGSGTPHANTVDGLAANLATLRTFVLAGLTSDPDATRPATLTVGASTWTADVQILNWQLARWTGHHAFISYDLRVPSGVWTAGA